MSTIRRTAGGLLVCDDALGLIGATPLVRLARISSDAGAQVWAKAEFLNPAGSVKDRPALGMVRCAEREGRLTPGATLIEATSGNTGISLAMIAAVRGYHCVVVMPEDMSVTRRVLLESYGARVELTEATWGMAGAVARAEELLEQTPGAFMPSQFDNPANPDEHSATTAAELLEQAPPHWVGFVAGVGTGGTLTGVARLLRERRPEVEVVAVEPARSAVLSGGSPGLHGIQGLGAGFVPDNLDRTLLKRVVTVTDLEASRMAGRLAREEGLLVGPSSGANVHAAVELARSLRGDVVTVLCDTGERYLA